MQKYLAIIFAVLFLAACTNDDDICVHGEATPRLKLKFKDKNNKLIQLPQLFVDVDYGSGSKNVVNTNKTDSVLIPLKIDGSGYTDLTFYLDKAGSTSTVRVRYTEESQYVSPACGIKRTYQNVGSELTKPNPVTNIEQVQTEIVNENKTHLYLIF